jgi:predicted NAD/FAD-dependent oxidoreductase
MTSGGTCHRKQVAVVGAGPAGAGAAYALRDAEAVEVTVFEAADSVGGRAATRRRAGCVYDHGANYVKADDDRVADLVRSLDDVVSVAEPVWTLDAEGRVSPGRESDAAKWTGRAGIADLLGQVLDRSGATVRTGTRVLGVARATDRGDEEERWQVTTEAGAQAFDAVVVTPPAPVTADLLSDASDEITATLAAAAADVPYRTVASVAIHYPFRLDRAYYALVDTSKAHPLGWVARESCKPGHVPDGESVLVAQPSPDWSRAHADDAPGDLGDAAAALVADALDDGRLRDPDWCDARVWRHALPDAAVAERARERAAAAGLHAAGDWVAGDGRVHRALRSGLDAGDRIAA